MQSSAPGLVPLADVGGLEATLSGDLGECCVATKCNPLRQHSAVLELIPLILVTLSLQKPPSGRTGLAVMSAVGG